jgi:Fe-S cluster assembly scaffold protein SufB
MSTTPEIDFQSISYFSAPKQKEGPKSLDEIDPALRETYNKLGIPIEEQMALPGSPWMRCSTASRWRPPSGRSSPRPA